MDLLDGVGVNSTTGNSGQSTPQRSWSMGGKSMDEADLEGITSASGMKVLAAPKAKEEDPRKSNKCRI